MAEALREGRKRRVARSDINATETATFLVAAWEGYVVLPPELRIRALKPSVSGMERRIRYGFTSSAGVWYASDLLDPAVSAFRATSQRWWPVYS